MTEGKDSHVPDLAYRNASFTEGWGVKLAKTFRLYYTYMKEIPIFLTEKRGSLDYFIWSDSLFGISIDAPSPKVRFDPNEIIMFDYGSRIGLQYNPAYIGWWAMLNLRRHLSSREERYLGNFRRQLEWFLKNQKEGAKGVPVWTYDFDWCEGETLLRAPWISAMSQGLGISCLVRGYRLEGEVQYLELARRASEIFDLGIEDGGVRTIEDGGVFYEEYPAYPLVRILDGFVFGLLGLFDLYEETEDHHVKRLFDEGLAGIKSALKSWDYRNVWSWYGRHGFLSPPDYNRLNAVLMGVLYQITGDSAFHLFQKFWDVRQKLFLEKMKTLFFLFLER